MNLESGYISMYPQLLLCLNCHHLLPNYSSSLPNWTFTLIHICHNHVFLISSNSFYL